ncbi:hypothetical protein, partial [Marinobacter sediminum]|uniref:hypothetical protein n=1 Tax=Marinobacter sediminum TaxID=256323 RepID=UPI003563181F
CFERAHSTAIHLSVNRFLKNFETQFLQQFQTVAFLGSRCVSGLSLRSGAHSTGVRKTVNALCEENSKTTGFHAFGRSTIAQFEQ